MLKLVRFFMWMLSSVSLGWCFWVSRMVLLLLLVLMILKLVCVSL